ncbi:MAG: biotin--[acetyl-CoA-carboxylase] ligase [Wenzhouxiangella sp.]
MNGAVALDPQRIQEWLKPLNRRTPSLSVEREVDSTNTHLARLRAAGDAVDIVIADAQSAGRGRRGRQWISPPGGGLYLSLFRAFAGPVRRLETLSLVAGLAATAAIEGCCAIQPGLKWPNDVLIDGRKLAGCLIDLGGHGACANAIIGIGINVDFGGLKGPDQPWTDLAGATGSVPDRNRLAALLIAQLLHDLDRFDAHGFSPFQARWADRDALTGREIVAYGPGKSVVQGQARGVDERGRLLLQASDRLYRLHGGEVTLRTSR